MDWGGAQWVLATYWVASLLVPALLRLAGVSTKEASAWRAWFIGRAADIVTLVLVLAWGGFWA